LRPPTARHCQPAANPLRESPQGSSVASLLRLLWCVGVLFTDICSGKFPLRSAVDRGCRNLRSVEFWSKCVFFKKRDINPTCYYQTYSLSTCISCTPFTCDHLQVPDISIFFFLLSLLRLTPSYGFSFTAADRVPSLEIDSEGEGDRWWHQSNRGGGVREGG
jgi:hypothetical protein